MEFIIYNKTRLPDPSTRRTIAEFLVQHLESYGDPISDIERCISYALAENGKPGGFILTTKIEQKVVGVVIINHTGMGGYIPENILVYIATHQEYRGKGIGKNLMKEAIKRSTGDIALHVEAHNPAKKLYEKLGFTNKYLEMRYSG